VKEEIREKTKKREDGHDVMGENGRTLTCVAYLHLWRSIISTNVDIFATGRLQFDDEMEGCELKGRNVTNYYSNNNNF